VIEPFKFGIVDAPQFDYILKQDPTITINPKKLYVTWMNLTSGELFICIDNTPDDNAWRGQLGTMIGGDVSDPNTVLLLPLATESGYADFSPKGHTFTPSGGMSISTADNEYGSSLHIDGVDGRGEIPSSSDFDFTGDFTVEMWVKQYAWDYGGLFLRGWYDASSIWHGLTFSLRMMGNTLRIYFYGISNATEQLLEVADIFVYNEWSHLAVCREGTVGRAYVNGMLKGTVNGLTITAASTYPIIIGDWYYHDTHSYWNGELSDIVINNKVAKYDGNFVPKDRLIVSF